MRDGVRLATDRYFPPGPHKDLPVVLERLPYNKKVLASRGAYFADRGYVFAAQDLRGSFRSEGRFEPFIGEGPDGYDSIEWLARHSWSSGKVGTIGASYGAYTQWQTALLHPPHLAAMAVSGSPSDRIAFENGVFSLANLAGWLNVIYRQTPEAESPFDAIQRTDYSILPRVSCVHACQSQSPSAFNFSVPETGQGGTRYVQNRRGSRYRKAQSLDDLGPLKVARTTWISHSHEAASNYAVIVPANSGKSAISCHSWGIPRMIRAQSN